MAPADPSLVSDERVAGCEGFLQHAVYASRERQAARAGLGGARLDAPSGPGSCGLGEGAELDVELTDEGRALAERLWPSGLTEAVATGIREVTNAWIGRQDALDRKRNHFIRDFRQAHGMDRQGYGEAETREFEDGLERINAEVREGLRRAATELGAVG